ncbi:MAG: amidohydrolase, partial [Acidobacteria bacterium]|nr:amidohydrolase [Acidobacteriota bacterium]
MVKMLNLHGLIVTTVLWLVGCAYPANQQMIEQRTAFTNATILTSSSAEPLHDGVLVMEGDRIAWVGPAADADLSRTRAVDLEGAMVIPGLVDAHAHLSGLGQALESVDLVGTPSYEEVIQRLQQLATSLPEGEWITGRGWDQNDWPEQSFPTIAELDRAIPDHPVAVTRIDGHALLANSRALERARIDASTPDPPGGSILRSSDGKPTGVFVDNAMGLINRVIPAGTRADHKRQLERAAHTAAAAGLTEVHDAGVSQETIDILLELAGEGRLPIRVYAMLEDDPQLLARWYQRGPLIAAENDRVTVRAIKLYADGALGSRGAALHEPYADAPDQIGLLVTPPEHLRTVAKEAKRHGFQVGAHAIGDRGTTIVIDAFESAGAQPEDRFRIEHLQIVRLADLERVAQM